MARSSESVHAILSRCPSYSRELHLGRALEAFDLHSADCALLRVSACNLADALNEIYFSDTPDDTMLQVSFEAFIHEYDEHLMLRRAIRLMNK